MPTLIFSATHSCAHYPQKPSFMLTQAEGNQERPPRNGDAKELGSTVCARLWDFWRGNQTAKRHSLPGSYLAPMFPHTSECSWLEKMIYPALVWLWNGSSLHFRASSFLNTFLILFFFFFSVNAIIPGRLWSPYYVPNSLADAKVITLKRTKPSVLRFGGVRQVEQREKDWFDSAHRPPPPTHTHHHGLGSQSPSETYQGFLEGLMSEDNLEKDSLATSLAELRGWELLSPSHGFVCFGKLTVQLSGIIKSSHFAFIHTACTGHWLWQDQTHQDLICNVCFVFLFILLFCQLSLCSLMKGNQTTVFLITEVLTYPFLMIQEKYADNFTRWSLFCFYHCFVSWHYQPLNPELWACLESATPLEI